MLKTYLLRRLKTNFVTHLIANCIGAPKIIGWHPHLWVWRPSVWKILDPSLIYCALLHQINIIVVCITKYREPHVVVQLLYLVNLLHWIRSVKLQGLTNIFLWWYRRRIVTKKLGKKTHRLFLVQEPITLLNYSSDLLLVTMLDEKLWCRPVKGHW